MSFATPQDLAALLNGRQYLSEMSKQETSAAAAAGLVVVSGYSDDGVRFFGAIDDDVGVSNGSEVRLTKSGLLQSECGCESCPYFAKLRDKASILKTNWDRDGYSWVYQTVIPHVTFDVMDGSDRFARAIVFALADVPTTP